MILQNGYHTSFCFLLFVVFNCDFFLNVRLGLEPTVMCIKLKIC